MALLAIENLFIEYPELGRVNCAVRDASLEIEPGEIIGLVGESGSGKSTLALAILGITRGVGRISSGSVVFDGQELLGLSDDEWRRVRGSKIGIVTQNPRGALNPIERIGSQIQNYYRHHRGVTEQERGRRHSSNSSSSESTIRNAVSRRFRTSFRAVWRSVF